MRHRFLLSTSLCTLSRYIVRLKDGRRTDVSRVALAETQRGFITRLRSLLTREMFQWGSKRIGADGNRV